MLLFLQFFCYCYRTFVAVVLAAAPVEASATVSASESEAETIEAPILYFTHPSCPCVGVPAVVSDDEWEEDEVSEDEPVRVGQGLHVRRHALVSVVDRAVACFRVKYKAIFS